MVWRVKQFGRFFATESDGVSGSILQIETPFGKLIDIEITERGFQTFLRELESVKNVESPPKLEKSSDSEVQIGAGDAFFGGDPP